MNRCLAFLTLICVFSINTSSLATEVPIKGDRVQLSLYLPSNACLPDVEQSQRFERATSAMDKTNLDIILLLSCKNGKFISPKDDYTMLQVNKYQTLNFIELLFAINTIDRGVKSQLSTIDPKAINNQVNRNIQNKLGINPGINAAFGYLGRDDFCVYTGGRMSFDPTKNVTPGLVVSCMSAVAGRVITISRYNYMPTANLRDLMKQARAILMSIHQIN